MDHDKVHKCFDNSCIHNILDDMYIAHLQNIIHNVESTSAAYLLNPIITKQMFRKTRNHASHTFLRPTSQIPQFYGQHPIFHLLPHTRCIHIVLERPEHIVATLMNTSTTRTRPHNKVWQESEPYI